MKKLLEFLNKNTYAETIDENYVCDIRLHYNIDESECSKMLGCTVKKGQDITEIIDKKIEKNKELKYYDSDLERNKLYNKSFYYITEYLKNDDYFEGFIR